MNSNDRNAYLKLGFLLFIAVLSVFVFISQKNNVTDNVTEKTDIIELGSESGDNQTESLQTDFEELEKSYGDVIEPIDLSSEELEKYITLKGFDFHAYYEDKYGQKEMEKVIKNTNELMKSIIQNKKVNKDQFKDIIFEEIQNGDFARELSIKEMNVFLMEPENAEEIILGVNVSYSGDKAEFFKVTVSTKDDFMIMGLVPEWSNWSNL